MHCPGAEADAFSALPIQIFSGRVPYPAAKEAFFAQ